MSEAPIITLAREAGADVHHGSMGKTLHVLFSRSQLERFAALVAAATGWTGKSNEHTRDGAMVAYPYRGSGPAGQDQQDRSSRMSNVAVLFARADSIYYTLPGTDVWDAQRDARLWPGGAPVVAHPPCRAWGRLAHMAKPRPDEKDLARWAVQQVREWGGVLEHPATSRLWPDQGLPEPRSRDAWGGWTLVIAQNWFGHKAQKLTRLYIVGIEPYELPDFPMVLGRASHVIASSSARQNRSHRDFRPEVTKAEREHTPPDLAVWLVELASRCRVEVHA